MKRAELRIDHFVNNKLIRSRKFSSRKRRIIIGSSADCDIRLVGEQVSGVHAAVEREDHFWRVLDLASSAGTFVDSEAIVEKDLKGNPTIRIAHHELRVQHIEYDISVFSDEKNFSTKGEQKQLVFVKKGGRVIQSHVLNPGDTFTTEILNEKITLERPMADCWQEKQVGDFHFSNKLVASSEIEISNRENGFGKSEKMSLLMLGVLCFVFIGYIAVDSFLNKDKKEVVQSNEYTRMIFDAKTVKKLKEESKKVAKTLKKEAAPTKTNNKQAASTASAPTTTPSTQKVLTNIRAANLGSIIGRISKRASRSLASAQVGVGVGTQSTSLAHGSAGIPSVSGVAGEVGNGNVKGSKFTIAAVGTSGRGGGVADVKGIGGLKAGKIGNADVGIVEDETEVDGGLDREVIAQYIKSQLGQIRYCYERQLPSNPDLYGKVQVQFTIGGSGEVTTQSIGITTLKSAMVEGCILRRIAGWKFPSPKGGTLVKVTYPFLFKSTN